MAQLGMAENQAHRRGVAQEPPLPNDLNLQSGGVDPVSEPDRVFCPLRAGGRARARAVSRGRAYRQTAARTRGAEVGIDATRRLLPVIGRLRAGMVPTT